MNNKPTVAISTDFLTAYAALPRQKQGKVTEFFNKFRNDPMHPGIKFEKINFVHNIPIPPRLSCFFFPQ